jgi:myosin heavy subunit
VAPAVVKMVYISFVGARCHVTSTVQEEYRREGLTFKRVDFVNNDATVSLLDGTGGILRTLEDVCR